MHSKSTYILMLSAWLLATGVQWDVVQVAAWARMFANYARVLPMRDAWELTFAAENMCGACLAVQDAKQDESGATTPSVVNAAKEPLVFQTTAAIVVAAPAAQTWMTAEPDWMAHERAQPPTPPPRGLA
jgi:hypothetical protein